MRGVTAVTEALRLRGEIAQAEVRAEGIGERACVQRIERRQASKAAGFSEGYNRAFDLLAGLAGKNNAVHSDRRAVPSLRAKAACG